MHLVTGALAILIESLLNDIILNNYSKRHHPDAVVWNKYEISDLSIQSIYFSSRHSTKCSD